LLLEDIIVADEKSGWKMTREESWGGREERKESRPKVQRDTSQHSLGLFLTQKSKATL
jgi:hypothetical protein